MSFQTVKSLSVVLVCVINVHLRFFCENCCSLKRKQLKQLPAHCTQEKIGGIVAWPVDAGIPAKLWLAIQQHCDKLCQQKQRQQSQWTQVTNRRAKCEELSADNATQTLAAAHRYHCPSHLTEPTETNFTIFNNRKTSHLLFGYIFSHIPWRSVYKCRVDVIANGCKSTIQMIAQPFLVAIIF